MHPQPQVGGVTVSVTADGVAHLGQVQRCASIWACNVCAPVIRERRAAEIDHGVAEAIAKGYSVYFVTATVRHKLGDDLWSVFDLLQKSWTRTFSGRAAKEFREATGYVGSIRTIEITHGVAGWHPHVHALLIFKRPAEAAVRALSGLYEAAVRSHGGSVLVSSTGGRSPGWDVRSVSKAGVLAKYMTKVAGGWGAGLELARADCKTGRVGSVVPGELLGAAVAGDKAAASLYSVFERATAGRRCIVWSRGLKAHLALEEITDDEAAISPMSAEVLQTWVIPAAVWRHGARRGLLGIWLNEMVAEALPLLDTG